jgi:hypothetical protein
MRKLPAAAIPEQSEVVDPTTGKTFVIFKIYNATPRAGRITWTDQDGAEYEVGGNERVEVVSLA